jgi:hypothetical protein
VTLAASAVAWMFLRRDGPVQPAAPFREEEIRFDSGGNTLAGVLVLPTTPGPYPAVAFVNGSGSLDRNVWMLHPALREQFVRHGIASLCWDKAGVGASRCDWTGQMEGRCLPPQPGRRCLDGLSFPVIPSGPDA